MTDPHEPVPAFAVSPTDQSSDRQQSDDDNTIAVDTQSAASDERAAMTSQAADNQAITLAAIQRIEDSANAQTASNEELALAMVEYQERARLARKRFRLTIAAILTVAVVLLAVLAVVLSKMNDELVSAARSRAQLADCIKPTGDCYKQGQRRTADAVATLQKITVLAATCAPSYVLLQIPERQRAIEACIKKGLK